MKHSSTLIKLFLIITAALGIWYLTRREVESEHKNSIIVGTNAEYRPFSFVENNQIVGLDIDIIKEVAQRIGKNIQLQDMSFTALIPEMQLGKIHVIAAGISPTQERARQMLFAEPHHEGDSFVLISKKNKPIHSVADLTEKTVVVNEGFTADAYISNIQGPRVVRLSTVADAFLTLASDRADAFISSSASVQPFFDQYGKDTFNIVTIPGTQEATALSVSKKHPELFEQIQQALHEMKEDGSLDTIKRKWKLL